MIPTHNRHLQFILPKRINLCSCRNRRYVRRALQEEIGILSPDDTVSHRNQPLIETYEKEEEEEEEYARHDIIGNEVPVTLEEEEIQQIPPKRIERKKEVENEDSDDRYTLRNGKEVTNTGPFPVFLFSNVISV